MAYHDDAKGFTPIIVGREYAQWLRHAAFSSYKLLKVNEATGYCVMRRDGHIRYISTTELSNWHICPVGK